jgi:hypothetical protein
MVIYSNSNFLCFAPFSTFLTLIKKHFDSLISIIQILKFIFHHFLALVIFVPGKTWAHVTHNIFVHNIEINTYFKKYFN